MCVFINKYMQACVVPILTLNQGHGTHQLPQNKVQQGIKYDQVNMFRVLGY